MSEHPVSEDLVNRLDEIEAWLADLEARQAEPTLGSVFRRLVPPEARRHLRAARKEQLLAARAFIDHMIDRLDREPRPRASRRERIQLE